MPSTNLSDTTPSAPGGGTNVKWQADKLGNISGYVPASGGVTSVAMTGDGVVFDSTVTGSPVTTSGTLAPTLKTQSANTVLAGPTSGAVSAPTFRALVTSDIPTGAGGGIPIPSAGCPYWASIGSGRFSGGSAVGNMGVVLSSVAAFSYVAPTATTPGGNSVSTAASNPSGFLIDEASPNVTLGVLRKLQIKAKISATSSVIFWLGLGPSTPTIAPFRTNNPNLNFVGFRFSGGTDTNYQCYTSTDNTHFSTHDTGVAADTAIHLFEVDSDGAGNITFFIDGVSVGTLSTNLPTSTTTLSTMAVIDNNGGSSARTLTAYNWYYQTI